MTERIDRQCEQAQLKSEGVNLNLPAMIKCSVNSHSAQGISRQSLIRQITKRPHKIQRNSLNNSQDFISEQLNPQKGIFRNMYKSRFKRERNSLVEGCNDLLSFINNPSDHEEEGSLWRILHKDIQKAQEQPLKSCLRHYQVKSHNTKFDFNKTREQTQDAYQQTKYLDLGEIGQYYARKEFDENQKEIQKEKACLEAIKSNIFEPWTSERVVKQISNVKADQINLLLQRDKQGKESEETQMNKNFVEKIDSYVQDLMVSRNLEFLDKKQSPLKDEIQSPSSSSIKNYSMRKLDTLSPRTPLVKTNSLGSAQSITSKRRLSNRNVKITNLENYIAHQKQPFDMYSLIDNLMSKVSFQQLCKQSAKQPSTMNEILKDDPRQQNYINCQKNIEPTLDLMGKIKEKLLVLEEYTIGEGLSNGFLQACQLDSTLINKIIIDNCSFINNATAIFFKGLESLKKVTRLCLKRVKIDSESAQKISNIAEFHMKTNSEELRIENCLINSCDLTIILQGILKGGNCNKLCIIGQTLEQIHIQLLIEIVSNSQKCTTNFDFSWTRSQPIIFLPLLQAICQNQRIVYLNLSWVKVLQNSNFSQHGFQAQSEQIQKIESDQSKQQKVLKSKLTSAGALQNKKEKSQKIKIKNYDFEKEVSESFINLINNNHKLLHVNFSEMGLTNKIIIRLMMAIKTNNTLMGIHLSGNPGLTTEIENQMMETLNATYETQLNLQSFQQVVGEDLRNKVPIEKQETQIQESMYLKQQQQEKKHEIFEDSGVAENAQARNFILTRKLGHTLEIPGSNEWELFKNNCSDCWICDRKIYTIFFWSPTIGRIEGNDTGLTPEQKFKILQLILENRNTNALKLSRLQNIDRSLTQKNPKKVYNENLGIFEDIESDSNLRTSSSSSSLDDVNQVQTSQRQFKTQGPSIILKDRKIKKAKTPMIYGKFNNWQPQPMIAVNQIAMALNEEPKPDFLQILKSQGLCRENVASIQQMRDKEREQYAKLLEEHRLRFNKDEVWTAALMKLVQYKQPHFTSVMHLKYINTRELYIAANFIGNGRQDFVVQYKDQFFFNQTIANFRREEIQLPREILLQKHGKVERNPNVFKNWQVDSDEIIENCCDFDFDYWKISNFLKNPTDCQTVQRIIKENYIFLKEIFTIIAAKSCFPCISSLECGALIMDCGFIDKNFTQGICDTQFIASRVDVEKRNYKVYHQNILDCNRFEFFEFLIRVANCKLNQPGFANSLEQSLLQIVEQIKINQYNTLMTSQQFREEFLWTREVNLVLDANLKLIRKLYAHCAKTKTKKLTQKEAIQLMTQDTSIKLSEDDARYCYAMSLQTTPDLVRNSFLKCCHIDKLEFLELIGRAAYFAFSDEQNLPLHEKIKLLLDEWLSLIGSVRKEAQYFDENDTQSDSN